MKNGILKYLWTGFKLMIVLLITGVVVAIVNLAFGAMALLLKLPAIAILGYILTIVPALIIDGYLIIKFKKFIFGGN